MVVVPPLDFRWTPAQGLVKTFHVPPPLLLPRMSKSSSLQVTCKPHLASVTRKELLFKMRMVPTMSLDVLHSCLQKRKMNCNHEVVDARGGFGVLLGEYTLYHGPIVRLCPTLLQTAAALTVVSAEVAVPYQRVDETHLSSGLFC